MGKQIGAGCEDPPLPIVVHVVLVVVVVDWDNMAVRCGVTVGGEGLDNNADDKPIVLEVVPVQQDETLDVIPR